MTESSLYQPEKNILLEAFSKDATIALSIQVCNILITYLVQICLAQWMGQTEYGIYEYVNSWALLLAIPACLGLPRTSVRLISEYKVKQEWGRLRGILRLSWFLSLLGGTFLALIVVAIVWYLSVNYNFVYGIPMLVGMLLLPLQSLVHLQMETARTMATISLAFIPSEIIWPILVFCGGYFLSKQGYFLTSLPMICVAITTLFIVVIVQFWLLHQKVNNEIEPATPIYSTQEWLGISVTLLLQQAFFTILEQSDILMVGSFLGPAQAGIYSAAVRTAHWIIIVLVILNKISAPRFATLYVEGDIPGLQKLVTTANYWIFWPSLLISLCLMFFTQPILSIFGPDFVDANLSLKILVIGRLFDALCGSVGCLMVMTGHHKKSLPVIGYCLIINLVLHTIAIPTLGMIGSAIATSVTMIISNVWLSFLVVKHIKINPSIFVSFFNPAPESEKTLNG